jgi:hypothetical protein
VLTCGVPSISTAVPRGKGEDGESCSEDESSEENQTVGCCLAFFFLLSFQALTGLFVTWYPFLFNLDFSNH